LAFYWSDYDSELVTNIRTGYPVYGESFGHDLVDFWYLLEIRLDRSVDDSAVLYASQNWVGKQNKSGYPKTYEKDFYIAGGNSRNF